jgi:hypothetical protein
MVSMKAENASGCSDESLSIVRIGGVNLPRTDISAVLGKTPLLANLSQPELQNLAGRTVRKLFSAGELICPVTGCTREGQAGRKKWFLSIPYGMAMTVSLT